MTMQSWKKDIGYSGYRRYLCVNIFYSGMTIYLSIILSACSTAYISDDEIQAALNKELVGRSVSEFIKQRNRIPDKTIELPDKTSMYVWENIPSSASYSSLCKVTLYAGSDGIITSAKSDGCEHLKVGSMRF